MNFTQALTRPLSLFALACCAATSLAQVGPPTPTLDARLVNAVRSKDVPFAKAMIAHGADANAVDVENHKGYPRLNCPVLVIAAAGGDLPMVRFLLDAGAKVDAKAEYDPQTRIKNAHEAFAVIFGGGDIGGVVSDGDTALLTAAGREATQIVQLLLEHGADVNAGNAGVTALIRAASGLFCGNGTQYPTYRRNIPAVLKLLLDHGANVNARDNGGGTALINAGLPEVVSLLLDRGADMEAEARSGWTALINAAACGRLEVVKLLLARGANVNANLATHNTALRWATANHQPAVVEMLKQAGAKE